MLEDGQDTRIVRRAWGDPRPVATLAPAVRTLGLLELFEPRSEVLRQVFGELEAER